MRVNKYLIFLIFLGLIIALVVFYVNHSEHDDELSTAKIKLLKELNFKPHKNKLTINENPSVTENKVDPSEFITAEVVNHQQRVDEVIYEGFDFQFGETKNDIVKNLGEPSNIVEKSIISRHRPDVSDKLYDLFYDGLEARIYHVTSDEKELVLKVLIKHEKYKVKYGLNIGVTKEYVFEVLGAPSIKEKDFIEFYDSNGFAKLRFYLDSNFVSMIEWNFEEN